MPLILLQSLAAKQLSTPVESQLTENLRLNPDSYSANHLLGEFYLKQNQLARGIPYMEKARAIDGTQYVNNYDLALAYLEAGRPTESRRVVEFLLKESDAAELHSLLGDIESADRHLENAAREYEKAARLEPTETHLFNLGNFLLAHNGNDQARIVFLYAVGRFPSSARLQVGLGVVYYVLGQYDDAVLRLCEAVDLDPKDTKALDFLGKMYDISPNYADEVTKRLVHFVQAYPDNAAANFYYGQSLHKRILGGEADDKSLHYLSRATELKPEWPQAHFELGRLYEDRHEFAQAVNEYEVAARLEPEMSAAHYHLATLYKKMGRQELADQEWIAFEALREKRP